MSHIARKFIALIMAIWLPLFSGNALAAAIAMQAPVGEHHSAAAQPDVSMPHCASMQQHTRQVPPDTSPDPSAGDNCGACHFACCGYLAAATLEVTQAQPAVHLFASLATQFQSITPIPLDPPPLARI